MNTTCRFSVMTFFRKNFLSGILLFSVAMVISATAYAETVTLNDGDQITLHGGDTGGYNGLTVNGNPNNSALILTGQHRFPGDITVDGVTLKVNGDVTGTAGATPQRVQIYVNNGGILQLQGSGPDVIGHYDWAPGIHLDHSKMIIDGRHQSFGEFTLTNSTIFMDSSVGGNEDYNYIDREIVVNGDGVSTISMGRLFYRNSYAANPGVATISIAPTAQLDLDCQLATDTGGLVLEISGGGVLNLMQANNWQRAIELKDGSTLLLSADNSLNNGGHLRLENNSRMVAAAGTSNSTNKEFRIAGSAEVSVGAGAVLGTSQNYVSADGNPFELVKTGPGTLNMFSGRVAAGTLTIREGEVFFNGGGMNGAYTLNLEPGTALYIGTTDPMDHGGEGQTIYIVGGRLATAHSAHVTLNAELHLTGALLDTYFRYEDDGETLRGWDNEQNYLQKSIYVHAAPGATAAAPTVSYLSNATGYQFRGGVEKIEVDDNARLEITTWVRSENGGLTKTGPGTLLLTDDCAWNGHLTVSEGLMQMQGQFLGGNQLRVTEGGTVQLSRTDVDGTWQMFPNDARLGILGGNVIVDAGTSNWVRNLFFENHTGVLNVEAGATLRAQSVGDGSYVSSGTLTKTGTGTLELTGGGSTWDGTLFIEQGTLKVSAGQAMQRVSGEGKDTRLVIGSNAVLDLAAHDALGYGNPLKDFLVIGKMTMSFDTHHITVRDTITLQGGIITSEEFTAAGNPTNARSYLWDTEIYAIPRDGATAENPTVSTINPKLIRFRAGGANSGRFIVEEFARLNVDTMLEEENDIDIVKDGPGVLAFQKKGMWHRSVHVNEGVFSLDVAVTEENGIGALTAGATVNVAPGATLQAGADEALGAGSGIPTINLNGGRLRVDNEKTLTITDAVRNRLNLMDTAYFLGAGAGGTLAVNTEWTNNPGFTKDGAGTLLLNRNLGLASGASLALNEGTFKTSGDVTISGGNVRNNGAVTDITGIIPGTFTPMLTISGGSFVQGADGTLLMEIYRDASGNYTQTALTADAFDLGGTLELLLTGSWGNDAVGDIFDLVDFLIPTNGDAGNLSGLFDSLRIAPGSVIGEPYFFSYVNDNTGITLGLRESGDSGVPEPAAWGLALMGLGCLGILRRRTGLFRGIERK